MTLILASTTAVDFHKGSEFTLRQKILDDDTGDDYDLTNTTVTLRMAHSHTDQYSVMEVLGSIIVAEEGLVQFTFTPEMTAELSVKGYDFSVMVDDYPAGYGRIGVLSQLPEVEA